MHWLRMVFILGTLQTASASAQPDDVLIRERDVQYGSAIAAIDQRTFRNLVTSDVRFVRGEGIVFGVENAQLRLAWLFGLKPNASFERTVETLVVSASSDVAIATGTNTVTGSDGEKSSSTPFLTVWRRSPEAEWRVAADGPLETWHLLEKSIVLKGPAHQPGLIVVELAVPELVEQFEPGTFRPSRARDLAYCVGEYVLTENEVDDRPSASYGYYLATWQDQGEGWKVLFASFPEPERRVTQ